LILSDYRFLVHLFKLCLNQDLKNCNKWLQ
jgi:hypothetical protein